MRFRYDCFDNYNLITRGQFIVFDEMMENKCTFHLTTVIYFSDNCLVWIWKCGFMYYYIIMYYIVQSYIIISGGLMSFVSSLSLHFLLANSSSLCISKNLSYSIHTFAFIQLNHNNVYIS